MLNRSRIALLLALSILLVAFTGCSDDDDDPMNPMPAGETFTVTIANISAAFDHFGSGDVTGQLMLWDAGSEANEEPGLGMNQAPRQTAADTGDDDTTATVHLVNDGFTYPAVNDVVQVT